MKRRTLMVLVCVIMAVVFVLAGCSATTTTTEKVTQTVTQPGPTVTVPAGTRTLTEVITETGVPTGPGIVTVTITQAIGTSTEASVVVLTGAAPCIPHGATVEGLYGFCFNCHPVPAGHTGRIANQDLCGQCHQQCSTNLLAP